MPQKDSPTAGRPEVGETVHYLGHGTPGDQHDSCRAATVAAVPDRLLTSEPNGADGQWAADLEVRNPTTTFLGVPHAADARRPGTWHRPEESGTKEYRHG